jgi:hypothetical protein
MQHIDGKLQLHVTTTALMLKMFGVSFPWRPQMTEPWYEQLMDESLSN